MEKMKAVVYRKNSSPDKLFLIETDKPVPNDDGVLIKVHAVSLNAADYRSMKMGIIPKRKIFGADISGEVVAIGKNVSRFKPGDEVLGDLASYGFGGLAEYVTAPEKALAFKPAKVSFEDASAMPMAAMTALQALRDKGNIRQGYRVLIVGCAGGVGTFAVQLAKYYEAEVTGVCSEKNIQQAKALGADLVIDYASEYFANRKERYDIILGVNGNYPLLDYRKTLASGGTYIMVGGALSQIFKSLLFGRVFSFGAKKMRSLAAKTNPDDLEFLADLMAGGKIKPVIEKRYPLEKAPEAMKYLAQGHSSGKIVIQVL